MRYVIKRRREIIDEIPIKRILLLLCCLINVTACRLAGGTGEVQVITSPGPDTQVSQSTTIIPSTQTIGAEPVVQRAELIICEIKGHITNPGIYELAQGSRVADLILRSGGILETGSLDWVNQARKLTDGEVVVIPAKGTTRVEYDAMQLGMPRPMPAEGGSEAQEETVKLVNINTASSAELETIPGIGPATAKNIIDYRTQNGPFAVLEDLKKVNRIGEKTFEKLKPYISIGS